VRDSIKGFSFAWVLDRFLYWWELNVNKVCASFSDLVEYLLMSSNFDGEVGPVLISGLDIALQLLDVILNELFLVFFCGTALCHLDLQWSTPCGVESSDDCNNLAAHRLNGGFGSKPFLVFDLDVLTAGEVQSDIDQGYFFYLDLNESVVKIDK
jgi:hypothetical protein